MAGLTDRVARAGRAAHARGVVRVTLFAAALLASAGVALAQPSDRCLTHSTEARYGAYGYDHVVVIRNGCDEGATCTVTTSSNPTAQTVRVAAGATERVVMFRGSPAREFSANVDCQ